MQVCEAMTPDVVSVTPETTLMEAAQLMRGLDVGPLPVSADGRLVGMIRIGTSRSARLPRGAIRGRPKCAT